MLNRTSGLVFQCATQRGVPGQARRPSPAISDAVDQRARRKDFAGTQIDDISQASGVFHFGIARRAFSFVAQQPGRRNKTARFQSRCAKFVARGGDSAERFVVIEIVKLAFVLGVKSGQQFIAKLSLRRGGRS